MSSGVMHAFSGDQVFVSDVMAEFSDDHRLLSDSMMSCEDAMQMFSDGMQTSSAACSIAPESCVKPSDHHDNASLPGVARHGSRVRPRGRRTGPVGDCVQRAGYRVPPACDHAFLSRCCVICTGSRVFPVESRVKTPQDQTRSTASRAKGLAHLAHPARHRVF
jgi:hypothetical protein